MKIAYISSSVIPSRQANSVHTMKMCQAFARHGHNVTLFVPNVPEIEPRVDDSYRFYGVEASFKIVRVPWVFFKGRGYVYAFLSALKARALKPDLVYGRFLPGCFFSCFFRLPSVYESHFPESYSSRIFFWMYSRIIRNRHLKYQVVISDSLRSYYMKQYGLPEDFITVAHDAADNPPEFKESIFNNSEKLQVGYVGNLYPGRGIEIIVELAKNCRWADFHLIGGHESDIRYWKQKVKKIDNIIFHGFVPPSETIRYCQSCDVLLAPYEKKVSISGSRNSDTAQWMSPIKIFEYMAAGKAILCSDLPVLKETLTHEKTALLCTPDEPQSWIKALRHLCDNTELRKRLGETAKQEFKAKYTWYARAKTVLRFA